MENDLKQATQKLQVALLGATFDLCEHLASDEVRNYYLNKDKSSEVTLAFMHGYLLTSWNLGKNES